MITFCAMEAIKYTLNKFIKIPVSHVLEQHERKTEIFQYYFFAAMFLPWGVKITFKCCFYVKC